MKRSFLVAGLAALLSFSSAKAHEADDLGDFYVVIVVKPSDSKFTSMGAGIALKRSGDRLSAEAQGTPPKDGGNAEQARWNRCKRIIEAMAELNAGWWLTTSGQTMNNFDRLIGFLNEEFDTSVCEEFIGGDANDIAQAVMDQLNAL